MVKRKLLSEYDKAASFAGVSGDKKRASFKAADNVQFDDDASYRNNMFRNWMKRAAYGLMDGSMNAEDNIAEEDKPKSRRRTLRDIFQERRR